jgi:hypothetical protein
MEPCQYEGDLQPLIRWAVNRGESQRERPSPPEPFRLWIYEQMPAVCRARMGYWVGIVTPESKLNDGWVDRYPHIHSESMGWHPITTTAMTYLVAPEEGGEFALGGEDPLDEYKLFTVTPGLTVMVDAVTWHGVLPVRAGTRIALITTGFPK